MMIYEMKKISAFRWVGRLTSLMSPFRQRYKPRGGNLCVKKNVWA